MRVRDFQLSLLLSCLLLPMVLSAAPETQIGKGTKKERLIDPSLVSKVKPSKPIEQMTKAEKEEFKEARKVDRKQRMKRVQQDFTNSFLCQDTSCQGRDRKAQRQARRTARKQLKDFQKVMQTEMQEEAGPQAKKERVDATIR